MLTLSKLRLRKNIYRKSSVGLGYNEQTPKVDNVKELSGGGYHCRTFSPTTGKNSIPFYHLHLTESYKRETHNDEKSHTATLKGLESYFPISNSIPKTSNVCFDEKKTILSVLHDEIRKGGLHPEIRSFRSMRDAWYFINRVKAYHIAGQDNSRMSVNVPRWDSKKLKDYVRELSDLTQKMEISTLLSLLPKRIAMELSPLIEKLIFAGASQEASESELSDFYKSIIEIYFHVGQHPRLFFHSGKTLDLPSVTSAKEISQFIKSIRKVSETSLTRRKRLNEKNSWSNDLRLGIPGTLHRVGLYVDKNQSHVLGYTVRVGRYIPYAGTLVAELMGIGSTIIIAPPCTGKTTIIRDSIANLCNSPKCVRVVVVDTSNEIVGDSHEPAPYFGTVRRLQVPERNRQSDILAQAVQNHSPEIVIIDEVGNTEECESICSIIHRGSKVLCSVHGSSLASVVRNLKLNVLFGGSQPLLLSYDEKRAKQKTRKTALERMNPTGFDFALQLQKGDYAKAFLYLDLNKVVDSIFDKEDWINGGSEFSFEVDLTKPLRDQSAFDQLVKILDRVGIKLP